MTRQDHTALRADHSAPPITAGHRWYRMRLRVFGPLVGLVPMGLLGAASWLVLRIGSGRASGTIGLVTGATAAPGLLVAGAPFADNARYPTAVLASVPVWLVLGLIASRRATRSLIASWRDYWRELAFLTVALMAGVIGAILVATALLGESLVF
jgi:hypothetical protein